MFVRSHTVNCIREICYIVLLRVRWWRHAYTHVVHITEESIMMKVFWYTNQITKHWACFILCIYMCYHYTLDRYGKWPIISQYWWWQNELIYLMVVSTVWLSVQYGGYITQNDSSTVKLPSVKFEEIVNTDSPYIPIHIFVTVTWSSQL